MNYEIKDNFLPQDFYKILSEELKSDKIPWFNKPEDVVGTKKTNTFFSFCYYNHHKPDHPLFEKHMLPFIKKLNIFLLIQIRANLCLRDQELIESDFHVDNESKYSTTGIFYLTDCNAKTILKYKGKNISIDSKENRMLIFDSSMSHKVVYQTDVHKRYIINFNYIKNESFT